ncbi:helix-turn-helix domain-containing protein [Brevibacillus dissolubilis]|uniref:helix-turn-helix domain-containing protein n=1 Tax=Brevibacillus dissolubilis TaxID=1844116 RepID=UPI001115D49E|nr:helix-turn-helix transcriptional regulator [Brevibacillus dissolubilis]
MTDYPTDQHTLQSLGELIRNHRKNAQLTLPQLAERTGLSKGVISKLENGETKRPELKTIRTVAHALQIPYDEAISYYIKVEQRPEILRDLLLEMIGRNDQSLIGKVAIKLIQSPKRDSQKALDELYTIANSVLCPSTQMNLYQLILKYAREHGLQNYVAKTLMQKFTIKRVDLDRLQEAYWIGMELLYYISYLTAQERVDFYYRLSIHSFNLKNYKESTFFCEQALKEDNTKSALRAGAILAAVNSFSILGDFETAEEYLRLYEENDYPHVEENARMVRAIFHYRKGELSLAIPALLACFEEASSNAKIHIANKLLELYALIDDFTAMEEIFAQEELMTTFPSLTPYKQDELARYYKHKAHYYVQTQQFREAIELYERSAGLARKDTNVHQEIYQSMQTIIAYHRTRKIPISLPVIEKMEEVFARFGV